MKRPLRAKAPAKEFKLEHPPDPPDPRHAPMVDALVCIYAAGNAGAVYAFKSRDAAAVAQLLALGDDEDIHCRWTAAQRARYPPCKRLSQLVERWNEFPTVRREEHQPEMRL